MLAWLGAVAGDVVTLTVLDVVGDDAEPPLELLPHAVSERPRATTPDTVSSRLHVLIRSILLHGLETPKVRSTRDPVT
jgi:hypothetical protein